VEKNVWEKENYNWTSKGHVYNFAMSISLKVYQKIVFLSSVLI
jgi:hypothetical protein